MRFSTILVVAAITAVLLPVPRSSADESHLDVGPDSPYCGVYAIHTAARHHGIETSFERLLDPKFVSSHHGSTTSDLMAAAEEIGLSASVFSGLTRVDLIAMDAPLIVHVKSSHESPEYDHWLLVLDAGLNGATIINEEGEPTRVDLADISTRWSGIGIAVDRGQASLLSRLPFYLCVIFLGAGIAALSFIPQEQRTLRKFMSDRGKWKWLPASVKASLVLLGIAIGVTAVHAVADDASILRHEEARAGTVHRNVGRFLPTLSAAEARDRILRREALVIDARYPRDYAAGHLPNAINIPIYLTTDDIDEKMPELARNPGKLVILYCQSEQCDFAERVARKLIDLGHGNLALFREGWQGWVDAGYVPKPRKPSPDYAVEGGI